MWPKHQKLIRSLLIYFLFFNVFLLKAQAGSVQSFSLITTNWENYTNKNGTGLYFDILTEIFGKNGYKYNFSPWKRAQVNFSSKKFDALLGETGGLDKCQYPKWPIDADFFSAFFLKSKLEQWPGKNELSKFKVIWVRGYGIDGFEPSIKPFAEVDDLEQGMKMIIGGRADILIDYDQDIKEYIKKNSLDKKTNLVTSTDISGGYIYLCFQKNEKFKDKITQFDTKMNELNKTGRLKQIFLKYDRIKNYNKVSNAINE